MIAKVKTLLPLPVEPNKFPSQHDLEKLGIWDVINETLTRRQWLDFFSIRDPYYYKLFVEFLASFKVDKIGLVNIFRPDVIRF